MEELEYKTSWQFVQEGFEARFRYKIKDVGNCVSICYEGGDRTYNPKKCLARCTRNTVSKYGKDSVSMPVKFRLESSAVNGVNISITGKDPSPITKREIFFFPIMVEKLKLSCVFKASSKKF